MRHIYILGSGLLLMAGAWGCTDDLDLSKGPGEVFADDGEGGLVFAVGDTRADSGFRDNHGEELSKNDEEIVINPDNFHVVLFSEKGEVKQIWANQELTEITEPDASLGTIKKYYVKIPRHDMADDVISYIRNNNFKIAVFANWDGYPDFSTNPNDIEENGISRNNIFYISHCRKDDSYSKGQTTDGQLNDGDVFGFITGKGAKMGIAQEWVCERFKDDNAAETEIRKSYRLNDDGSGSLLSNTKPILTNSQGDAIEFSAMDDYTYYNLWQVWNFGGDNNLDYSTFYKAPNNYSLRAKWAEINNDWYAECFNGNNTRTLYGTHSNRGLELVSPESGTAIESIIDRQNYNPSYNYGLGIVLPRTYRSAQSSNSDDYNQTIDVSGGSYIHYMLPAYGALYVKCRAKSGNATLTARKGGLSTTGKDVYAYSETVGDDGVKEIMIDYSEAKGQVIRVTGEPADLVLYATDGDLIIYEIDFIEAHALQVADRQMINPASTPEGGISMYGIQDFDKLTEDIWPDGTTFNLSRWQSLHTGTNARSYYYRTISLLRSVAKVEVLVPTSIFPKPSHMFMRTLNRFSRSAPIDVFTPTNLIWDGWNNSDADEYKNLTREPGTWDTYYMEDAWGHKHYYSKAEGVDKESQSIKDKGFTYKNGSNNVGEYRNAVAWLFGIWSSEYGWDWNGYSITIGQTGPYPNVFNTRISRSDYAHMIDGGKIIHTDGKEYYYYYAYVPEKNVTDPNDKGTLGESPKVMRIEMRFGDRNTDVNLDDNASYRIYFTQSGKGGGIESRDDYDNNMEKGSSNENSVPMQNLKSIYPVMRNHLYRFKITGIEMNELQVEFDVPTNETRDIEYTFD